MIGRALHELIGLDELTMFEEKRIVAAEGMLPTFLTHDGSSNAEGRRWQDLETDKSRDRGKKGVYLRRDPRDVVVSCFSQATRRRSSFRRPMSELIRTHHSVLRP